MSHDHSTEPHEHTMTFFDNDGQSYSAQLSCPSSPTKLAVALEETGADSVNDWAYDGRKLSFETTFSLLGEAGMLHMLGRSYQTEENLVKLFVAMGTDGESK